MKSPSFLLVLAFLPAPAMAETQRPELPPSLAKLIEQEFPQSEVVAVSSSCRSDVKGPLQAGLVLSRAGVLRPVLALSERGDEWIVSELPKSVSSRNGAIGDFLDEFTSQEDQIVVRCAKPGKDADIGLKNMGVFVSQKGRSASAQHVCFSASAVYNSWVCYWTDPKAKVPEVSFVQLNAD